MWCWFFFQDDDEGEEGEEEEDDDDGSEMELDEDYPDMNASPLVRFERFDREDDLIIEFDNMFSGASKSSETWELLDTGGILMTNSLSIGQPGWWVFLKLME